MMIVYNTEDDTSIKVHTLMRIKISRLPGNDRLTIYTIPHLRAYTIHPQ